jgi:hypothetical protein
MNVTHLLPYEKGKIKYKGEKGRERFFEYHC